MLTPSPQAVRELLARYAIARFAHAERETPESTRQLAEVTGALCALTRKATIHDALDAADELLARSRRPVGAPPSRRTPAPVGP